MPLRSAFALAALLAACGAERATPVASAAPERIVTLAPHLAELVYAAGAGERLAAVSAYSDYPAEVTSLPVVSDAFNVDQEQLALIRPDLLLAWQSGNAAHIVESLRQRGYRVEVIRTQSLADIAAALRRIGRLAGTAAAAEEAAAAFESELADLQTGAEGTVPLRAFYQVSARPLYTVNGDHYISELLGLCGAKNIFADLRELAPLVSEEAVLARDPQVMLAADVGDDPFAPWRRWPQLAANRTGSHYTVSADLIGRPTPRVIEAGRQLCARLALARARLSR